MNTTPQPQPIGASVPVPRRVTRDDPPQFPCELWDTACEHWTRRESINDRFTRLDLHNDRLTHWRPLPDQPQPPAVVPVREAKTLGGDANAGTHPRIEPPLIPSNPASGASPSSDEVRAAALTAAAKVNRSIDDLGWQTTDEIADEVVTALRPLLQKQADALAKAQADLAHRWECQQILERTVKGLQGDVAAKDRRIAELEALFKMHTEAVGAFLNELYAIMVDPLADETLDVSETKAALLRAAKQQREQLQIHQSGLLRTIDHPEANGRKPVVGETAYELSFTLENGCPVKVVMGQTGFDTTTNLLMDMLSGAPSHDDGSTSITPYQKLRNRMESAELRAQTLESRLHAAETAAREKDAALAEQVKFVEACEEQVALVYCEITGGRFSKMNTDAGYILEVVREREEQAAREGAGERERLLVEMKAVWDHVQAISPWSESNDMLWSDEVSCGLGLLEKKVADLQEERDACIELFAAIEKLMTNDDGVDPEAWWVEFGPDEAQMIRTLAAKFKAQPLPDYLDITKVPKQPVCAHGTPAKYYCAKCGGEPKI